MGYEHVMRETSDWEKLWKRGIPKGACFDMEQSLPELERALRASPEDPISIPAGQTAMVPGYGRGYDLVSLAQSGRFERVFGVEVSETATATAKEYVQGQLSEATQTKVNFLIKDFFTLSSSSEEAVDFVYDYTFFCAIPIERRPEWGRVMGRVVKSGGTLVTVMFPYEKREGGPPFQVDVDAYRAALEGFFIPVDGPRQLADDLCHAGREGRTWWCRWRRVDAENGLQDSLRS